MRQNDRYRIKIAAAATLGVATLAAAGTMAWAWTFPQANTPVSQGLADVHEARAVAAAVSGQRRRAEDESRLVLAEAPLTPSAWLRLAQVRSEAEGFDDQTLALLERSYTVSPFGPRYSEWRVRFLYEHWRDLTPSLRRQAAAELTALKTNGRLGFKAGDITDPAGRTAARMTLRLVDLRREARLRAEMVARETQS